MQCDLLQLRDAKLLQPGRLLLQLSVPKSCIVNSKEQIISDLNDVSNQVLKLLMPLLEKRVQECISCAGLDPWETLSTDLNLPSEIKKSQLNFDVWPVKPPAKVSVADYIFLSVYLIALVLCATLSILHGTNKLSFSASSTTMSYVMLIAVFCVSVHVWVAGQNDEDVFSINPGHLRGLSQLSIQNCNHEEVTLQAKVNLEKAHVGRTEIYGHGLFVLCVKLTKTINYDKFLQTHPTSNEAVIESLLQSMHLAIERQSCRFEDAKLFLNGETTLHTVPKEILAMLESKIISIWNQSLHKMFISAKK